ncbi:VOC family protein [Pedobacter sp. HMF7647]|uniref:VOC family protein n=1 Tax=Hufsiella arboris TaxID=2695275 RepID=A0A7K1Y648_9SPHI|nr:VOC family protein [Hufsiella arboris]MXV50054.1 VOC family protein [Hufsiella arboris]
MANLINWLEIPVSDMERAKKFYEQVLNAKIEIDEQMAPGFKMGMINTEGMTLKDLGGSLVQGAGYEPGQSNTLVYLNANETGGCDAFLERVQQAGGKVTGPTMQISPDIGFCAFFTDTEGNRMAVHSQNK